MPGIQWVNTMDNSGVVKGLEEVMSALKKVGALAGITFSVAQAKSFVERVADMRGYFQDIESSMKVFLGSAEKGAEFTKKLKDYAYYNMFEFKELAQASQQMIAYGHDVDSIIHRLDQLSNVAVGTHGSIMEMVASYNKAKSTGIVDGRDIQSWAIKGVMIKDELKKMGDQAIGTSISFEQLNKVLDQVTGEGGMFHNLQLSMMENISAEIGQFQDNLDSKLNEIGERYQDIIVSGIKLGEEFVDSIDEIDGGIINAGFTAGGKVIEYLRENFKELAAIIRDGVAAYGSYRAALVVTNAIQKAHAAWVNASTTATRINSIAVGQQTVATNGATAASVLFGKAMKALNASLLASPWTWVAVAIAGVTFAIYKVVTAETAMEKGIRLANDELERQSDMLKERKDEISGLISTIKDDTQTEYARYNAYKKLKEVAPELTEEYNQMELASMSLDEVQKLLNKNLEDADMKEAKENVDEYTKKVEDLKTALENYYKNGLNVGDKDGSIFRQMRADLITAETQLEEFTKDYEEKVKEMEKVQALSRPIEVRLQEANSNHQVKKEILEFFESIATVSEDTDVFDMAKGRERLEEFLRDVDGQVKDLQTELENNPLNEKLAIELEEKKKLQNELLILKSKLAKEGYTTFDIHFRAAQDAVKDAETGGDMQEGMYFNYVTGQWEAVMKEEKKTLKEWRGEQRKSLREAEAELKRFNQGSGEYANATYTEKEKKEKRTSLENRIKGIKDELGTEIQSQKEMTSLRVKRLQEEWKYEDELTEIKRKGEEARAEATIAAIEDEGKRERAARRHQAERSVRDYSDSVKSIYKDIYKQRKDAYELANKDGQYELTEQGSKGWGEGAMSGTLTEKEKQYFDLRNEANLASLNKDLAANAEYNRKLDKQRKEDLANYLKEVDDYEKRRLGIKLEYDEKIEAASSPYAKASLELKRDKEIESLEAGRKLDDIDWNGVFNSLKGHTEEYLVTLRDQLQGLLSSGEITDVSQMAVIQEKIAEINGAIDEQSSAWGRIGDFQREYNRRLKEAEDAQERLNAARQQESDLAASVEEITSKLQDALGEAGLQGVDIDDDILTQFDEGSDEFKRMADLLRSLRVAEGKLADARKVTRKATSDAAKAEDATKTKTSDMIAGWFSDLQQKLNKFGLNELPDLLGKVGLGGLGEKAQQGLNAVNSAAGAAADFASGNYVGAAMKAFDAFSSVGDLLGIGGSSDKTLHDDIERLTNSNEALEDAVANLASVMEEASVMDATDIYDKQVDFIKQTERNTQEMMARSAAAYSTGTWGTGIGGSRSSNYKIDKNINASEWQQVSNIVGRSVKKATDFFNLSSEQMWNVRQNLPVIYARIKQYADDGYEDAAVFMDKYTEFWKELEDSEQNYFDKMTSVTFDSIQSDFASTLMDMDSDAKDLSENFEEYLKQAIMQAMLLDNYKPWMEKWYKMFAQYMEDGLTEAERKALKEGGYVRNEGGVEEWVDGWDKQMEKAIDERNALRDTWGWDKGSGYSQEASARSWGSMSQDTGEELNGRFTALQIAGESINANVAVILSNMQALGQLTTASNTTLNELRSLHIISNTFLEDIAKYTKPLLELGGKLDKLIENTK